MEGIQHRGGKGRRKTEGPVEAVGALAFRTQVKHRKAWAVGELVPSSEARYPSVRSRSGDGMTMKSVDLTQGDLSGSERSGRVQGKSSVISKDQKTTK
jgi:hypothetical protein